MAGVELCTESQFFRQKHYLEGLSVYPVGKRLGFAGKEPGDASELFTCR
jgi:hypothetical protein